MARCSGSARKIERQRKSAQDGSLNFPGPGCPQGHRVSVPDCRAGPPTFSRRRQEVRMDADRPAEAFFLFHRAVAQPLAALPPYAGQPFAASPRYGCRVPLAGRCGIPLAGTAHLSSPKCRPDGRLAPTRACGRSLFDASKRKWGAHSHPSVGTGIRTASAGWSPPYRRRPPGP